MLAYAVAIVVAIIVIPVTNGSITRLADLRFRRAWLLVVGLALQVGLDVVDLPRTRYEDVGVAVLLLSYAALLGFCASNLRIRGIELIGLGIALNLGMPYKVADGMPRETTVKHRPTRDSDIAVFLSDQMVVGDPVDAAVSVGDLVLAVGIVELAYVGSRRPRRRGHGTRVVDLTAADEIDLRDGQPTGSAVSGSASARAARTTRSKASSTRRS